jgi:hypothetical protein
MDIWTLNLTTGLNTTHCPPWESLQPSNSTNNSTRPYMYGVAYATADQDVIVQTGDGGTPVMMNGVKYDLVTHTWTIGKR